jgi:hypothetical protein
MRRTLVPRASTFLLLGSAFTLALSQACSSAAERATPIQVVGVPEQKPAPAAFTPFLNSERCALCHSHSPDARALTTQSGDDASPFGTWQATAMANAFRDPYWRAQMAREVELDPSRKAEIEGLCLTCHAPAATHTADLAGSPRPAVEAAAHDSLASDGVTCTVCHRTTSTNLGRSESFGGHLDIRADATIYGPFADPTPGPMKMHTGFTPTHGPHVRTSALCGACHTLYTRPAPAAAPYLEQAPYLEWRNSIFSDEGGALATSRTCQECHMPDGGSMRIARKPNGTDFNIAVRDGVREHAFVGGNAFLIDMLRINAAELGVTASQGALKRIADATRAQLAHATARLTLLDVKRTEGRLEFDVRVENLTGHKLPSGYPSRRMWLDVEIRSGGKTIFESGDYDEQGRLRGIADELALPHVDRVESARQVAVYETIARDLDGRITTNIARMATRAKDNRLLPRGWKRDGPHADETHPIGTEGDDDFEGGSDRVTYSAALPADAQDVQIVARLCFQTIPPAWASALESSNTEEARRFLSMNAKMDHAPEILGTVALSVP